MKSMHDNASFCATRVTPPCSALCLTISPVNACRALPIT